MRPSNTSKSSSSILSTHRKAHYHQFGAANQLSLSHVGPHSVSSLKQLSSPSSSNSTTRHSHNSFTSMPVNRRKRSQSPVQISSPVRSSVTLLNIGSSSPLSSPGTSHFHTKTNKLSALTPTKSSSPANARYQTKYSQKKSSNSKLQYGGAECIDEIPVDYRLYQTLFKNKRRISISYGLFDTQGHRPSMEDEYFFVENLNSMALNPTQHQIHCAFGIFDGHCGKDAATYCKDNLCAHILKAPSFQKSIERALQEGFVSCDESLRKYSIDEEKASPFAGCTANVAIIRDNVLTVANCGDSRAVLANGGKAVPMSEDHKPNRPDEKKRIESLGGMVMFGRVGGLLAVSRALGDFEYKIDGKHLVTATPDVKSFTLNSDSDFVIVACDGLWDVMSSEESVKFAYQWMLETHNLDIVCERLVHKALERRSMDNITCMIVALHEFE